MSISLRGRAWRFAFPGDAAPGHGGLGVSPTGAIETVGEAEAVRQAILMLISTRPGERVMRPGYGCHLFRLAFAPNDDTTAGLAIHYVRQALERWEPRIEILKLDAERDEALPGAMNIHLQYRLRTRRSSENLSVLARSALRPGSLKCPSLPPTSTTAASSSFSKKPRPSSRARAASGTTCRQATRGRCCWRRSPISPAC